MEINFTEEEILDILMSLGYVLCQRREIVADNIYQNVFVDRIIVVETVFKQGKEYPISEAFKLELKKALINKLWQ